jgi:hypothetical protein
VKLANTCSGAIGWLFLTKISGIEVVTPEAQTFWYGLAHSMSSYLHDYIAGPTSGTVGEPLYEN